MSTTYRPAPVQQRPQAYNNAPQAAPQQVPGAPAGTFAPGTKVQVGKHRVIIERYLSEGGFAHVYSVRVPRPDGTVHAKELAVLKRVAVPDKDALANMRTEVETMKKLQGHKKVVTYMDSHASQLKGGGYEVFLLMEYCQGGGLIDFMNTRLQNRLTEPEILKIFADVAEGVAAMHYLVPPLLHRDLKVENVLISTSPARVYKLCDFGSAAPPRPAAQTAAEGRLIEDDVQRHTTLQYRSPEMIDVYRKQPIDEKSDIWALGVLLYKLCYYTTPFEEQGQMAILNASFKYPQYPVFSDKLKHLIGSMLRENPDKRPNIYEVVKEVCTIRGAPVPIKDIYATRSHSQARRYQEMPPPSPTATSPPAIGLQKAEPVQQAQRIPDIAPMRRGRPTAPGQQRTVADHTPSPMRGAAADPFAALDSNNPAVRAAAADELASKYPSLDEFSILHDKGSKFQFEQSGMGSPPTVGPKHEALQKRVTEALADDAFAQPSRTASAPASKVASETPTGSTKTMGAPRLIGQQQEAPPPALPVRRAAAYDQPSQSKSPMVSTAVGSSPPSSPYLHAKQAAELKQPPIHRFPPRISSHAARDSALPARAESGRPILPDLHRSKSSITTLTVPSLDAQKAPASSRPSLEGRRPSNDELEDSEALARSRSANARPTVRPSSLYVDRNFEYPRDRDGGRLSAKHRTTQSVSRDRSPLPETTNAQSSDDDEGPLDLDRKESNTIHGDVDYLRAREAETEHHHHGGRSMKSVFGSKKDRRSSGDNSHHKRSSFGAVGHGFAKTGEIMKGRFGDAFRRFEAGNSERNSGLYDEPPASPGPENDSEAEHRLGLFNHNRDSSGERKNRRSEEHSRRSLDKSRARASGEYERERHLSRERGVLTPIAGSEAPSSGPRSDMNDDFYDRDMEASFMEEQDLPPEVRRELERQRLAQEERRVEAAKEAYRQRAAGRGGGESKASTIQKRVMTLLDEAEGRSREPPKKTAEGYGRYNEQSRQTTDKPLPQSPPQMQQPFQPPVAPKPVPGIAATMGAPAPSRQQDLQYQNPRQPPIAQISTSAPPAAGPMQLGNGPPSLGASSTTSMAIASNPRGLPSSVPSSVIAPATSQRPPAPPKPSGLRTPQRTGGPSLEHLLQKDLQGVADMPGKAEQQQQPRLDREAQQRWGGGTTATVAAAPGPTAAVGGVVATPDADWEEQFSKRYPSLSGIEMVEADIGGAKVRDV